MAFTGKKHKGSRVLTDETVKNHKEFYKLLDDIKNNDVTEYEGIKEGMFEKMFYHLSHSAQREMLDWARSAEWKTFFKAE